ncbi:MAG: YraN family protein [Phycisphaeraceae bacterium]|nr:YraN family protein [Phycisphaeraceae bacterium]
MTAARGAGDVRRRRNRAPSRWLASCAWCWPLLGRVLGRVPGRRPRAATHLRTGAEGERLATIHLRACGYRILARNRRFGCREVDLIAIAPSGELAIVEVKTTRGRLPAERQMRADKRRALRRSARDLARRTGRDVRIDLISVHLPRPERASRARRAGDVPQAAPREGGHLPTVIRHVPGFLGRMPG